MKEKEGFVDCPEQQMILYVEKDDGNYGPMQTGSYITANYLDDFFLKKRNLEAELRTRLIAGEISPVKYHMVLEDLTLSELAARASIRKSRVKKHLEMKYFGTATAEELRRYARVFNIAVPNMLQVVLISDAEGTHAAVVGENRPSKVRISQEVTGNPFVVVTQAEENNQ